METGTNKKKPNLKIIILVIVAFLCALAIIAGLDEPHFSPFSVQVELDSPTSLAISEDGAAVIDSQNKRMLIYSNEKTVSKIVEATSSSSVVNEFEKVTISGEYIYAIGGIPFNEGTYLSSESIIQYDLDGNYVKTLATRSYDEEEYVNRYFYRSIICHNDVVYVTCVSEKNVEVICLGDTEETLGTWGIPENIYTATYLPANNSIAVIGMSKNGYLVDCDSSDIQQLTFTELIATVLESSGLDLSKFDLEEIEKYNCIPTIVYDSNGLSKYIALVDNSTGETKIITGDDVESSYFKDSTYSFWLFLPNLLFYIALGLLSAGAAVGLVWIFIKKFTKRARIVAIVIAGIILTSVFYTIQINTTIEDEFARTIVSQTKQESYLLTKLYGDELSKIQDKGIDEFCSDSANQNTLQEIHDGLKAMCDSDGTERSCLVFTYLFGADGQAYSFVDSKNFTLPGQPIYFSDDVIEMLESTESGDVLTVQNPYETLLCCYGYIYDSEANIIGVICTAAFRGNISYAKVISAVNLSIALIILFIGIYVLMSTIKRFSVDIKRRSSRDKSDNIRRSVDMAGIMTFATSMVTSLDSAIIVYVAESLCIDMDPATQAILTALPLTAVTVGWMVGNFIADSVIRKIGERSAAIVSSVLTILAMLFCMFSISNGSIVGYIIGKLVQNITLNGVLYIEINTLPYKAEDDETRRTSLNSIIQNGAAASIISMLISGLISEYLSYATVYLIGGILSAVVLIISLFVFKNAPKENGRSKKEKLSDSGKYWTIFFKKPMLLYLVFCVVPTILISGYKSYLFPMYTSAAGISALMLSSINILVKALTYVTNDSLSKFSERLNPKVALVAPRFLICAGYICFLISPNIYWAIIMLFMVDILLRMTSIPSKIHIAKISKSYSLNAKRVQSNYYTVFSVINTFKSPMLSGIVSLGMNLACSVVGIIAGAMLTVFALFNRKK